jgi:hypothetical protein
VVAAGTANGATSPSMNDLDYLRAFYAAGAKGSFDALGTHPYGGNTAPESTSCGGTCFRRAELQRQIMVDYGDSATPMWATEVGWLHESQYDMGPYFEWQKVSAQQQADYLVRAFQFAEANWAWMGPMFVFNHDHSTAMWCNVACYPPTTSVHWFSILNPDRSARPAYTALSDMPKTSSPPSTTPPTAPSALTATAASSSQINLAWTDNATDESGFKIERSTDGASFTQVATVGANATTYADSGLSASTTYHYRVRAYNATGDSAYSNTATATTPAASATLAAPSELTLKVASSSRIDLTWRDNSSDETGFKIERSTNGTSFTQIATVGADVTTYSNTGLSSGTRYYYRVRAYNAGGNSAYSNTANARTSKPPRRAG